MKYKKFNRFLMFLRNEEYNKVILDHFFQLRNNNNNKNYLHLDEKKKLLFNI